MAYAAALGAMAMMFLIGGFAAWILREGRLNDRHKRAMLAKWFCPECGYPVHATPAERCPECGHPIPPKFPPFRGR